MALFTRTSTGVTLTPAGKGFKGYAEQIVNLVNQALVASHQYSGQRQVIRLVLADIVLELRVQGDVGLVIEDQVVLALGVTRLRGVGDV